MQYWFLLHMGLSMTPVFQFPSFVHYYVWCFITNRFWSILCYVIDPFSRIPVVGKAADGQLPDSVIPSGWHCFSSGTGDWKSFLAKSEGLTKTLDTALVSGQDACPSPQLTYFGVERILSRDSWCWQSKWEQNVISREHLA